MLTESQGLEPFQWQRTASMLGAGMAIILWDRWPLTHGSGVARHDDPGLGVLVATGGLVLFALAMISAFKWVDAWLAWRWSPLASSAWRVAAVFGLFFGWMLAAVSGLRLD